MSGRDPAPHRAGRRCRTRRQPRPGAGNPRPDAAAGAVRTTPAMKVPWPAYGWMFAGSMVSGSPSTPAASHGEAGSVAAGGCQPVSTTETNTSRPPRVSPARAGYGAGSDPGSSGSVAGQSLPPPPGVTNRMCSGVATPTPNRSSICRSTSWSRWPPGTRRTLSPLALLAALAGQLGTNDDHVLGVLVARQDVARPVEVGQAAVVVPLRSRGVGTPEGLDEVGHLLAQDLATEPAVLRVLPAVVAGRAARPIHHGGPPDGLGWVRTLPAGRCSRTGCGRIGGTRRR